ncbi:MAG: acetolactate synthase [Chitinophagaceae bacterium]|nr:MAG: acetolactate synthase [Chitinophagaceae bacterium]
MMKFLISMFIAIVLAGCGVGRDKPMLVFQTDFGLKDGAVSAMKGVAKTVDPELGLYDLTHEIPPYDIWEAAYRLNQTISYWPMGTVFVSVVDPGVGTSRKSVVALLTNGQYVVTPDNGVLTLVAKDPGIITIREIDEKVNRREGSGESYTFHGRDVYAYVAARLASGKISFDEVGPISSTPPVALAFVEASYNKTPDGPILQGGIPALDRAYGNVWTNISDSLLKLTGLKAGDSLTVEILHDNQSILKERMPYVSTFGAVPEGQPLAYLNSLLELSFALNMQDFATKYGVGKGPGWKVRCTR